MLEYQDAVDEAVSPGLGLMFNFFFSLPPLSALSVLDLDADGDLQPAMHLLYEYLNIIKQWLDLPENRVIVGELLPRSESLNLRDRQDEENRFLAKQKGKKDHARRIKILAGINALDVGRCISFYCEEASCQSKAIEPYVLIRQVVLLVRSMAQFCGNYAAQEGVDMQKKRRKPRKAPEKEGLLAIKKNFSDKNPGKSKRFIWVTIKQFLTKNEEYRHKDYIITFREDVTNYSKISGKLCQKKVEDMDDDGEICIGFEAFRKLGREVDAETSAQLFPDGETPQKTA